MSKLRRERGFLERRIKRVRSKLDRLQQDPTQTSSMSVIGIRLEELIDQ